MSVGLELVVDDRRMLWRQINEGSVVIGSNPECDLCLPDPNISPVQCVIFRRRAVLTLENKDPQGTKVNGELVLESFKLANGDEVSLGPVVARVCFNNELAEAVSNTQTLTSDNHNQGRVFITVPDIFPGRAWEVNLAGIKIGTDKLNDIVLSDPYVSSFHAIFTLENGRCMVRDLDSRNGVFVGTSKVREGEVPLGEKVKLGQTYLAVKRGEQATSGKTQPNEGLRLLGRSAQMTKARENIERLAASDATVLISGETGTGKEVVAALLAQKSSRAKKPFLAINCGSLGRQIIESELFGHERGAFTGAIARKIGAFEAANRGTLFLDEIGELPLELQPQLLRVLETGEVRRVGSTEIFKVDVRIIAATNRNLAEDVGRQSFREDLYHRLHVVSIDLPPLRERLEDVEDLAAHFLEEFTPNGQNIILTAAGLKALKSHFWPGNVRELRNTIARAVLLRRSSEIDAADISFTPSSLASRSEVVQATARRTLEEIERTAIVSELQRAHGNKKEAAAALGISRSTIHRKIDELAIETFQLSAE